MGMTFREWATIARQLVLGWWHHKVLVRPYVPADEVLRELERLS